MRTQRFTSGDAVVFVKSDGEIHAKFLIDAFTGLKLIVSSVSRSARNDETIYWCYNVDATSVARFFYHFDGNTNHPCRQFKDSELEFICELITGDPRIEGTL